MEMWRHVWPCARVLRKMFRSSPNETKWDKVNPVKSSESKWNQMNRSEIEWNQVSPSESKWNQVSPRETKWVQVKLRETKGDQVSPSETKWAQVGNPVKSNESNWNQMIQVRPSGPKWVQVKLRETKWVQLLTATNLKRNVLTNQKSFFCLGVCWCWVGWEGLELIQEYWNISPESKGKWRLQRVDTREGCLLTFTVQYGKIPRFLNFRGKS